MDPIKRAAAHWIEEYCQSPDELFSLCEQENGRIFNRKNWLAKVLAGDNNQENPNFPNEHCSALAAYINELDVREIVTITRAARKSNKNEVALAFLTLTLENAKVNDPKHVAVVCSTLRCWLNDNTINGLEFYAEKRQWIINSRPKLWQKILERDSIVRPFCDELTQQLVETSAPRRLVRLLAEACTKRDPVNFPQSWLDAVIAAINDEAMNLFIEQLSEIPIDKMLAMVEAVVEVVEGEIAEIMVNKILCSANENFADHVILARGALLGIKKCNTPFYRLQKAQLLKNRPTLYQALQLE